MAQLWRDGRGECLFEFVEKVVLPDQISLQVLDGLEVFPELVPELFVGRWRRRLGDGLQALAQIDQNPVSLSDIAQIRNRSLGEERQGQVAACKHLRPAAQGGQSIRISQPRLQLVRQGG